MNDKVQKSHLWEASEYFFLGLKLIKQSSPYNIVACIEIQSEPSISYPKKFYKVFSEFTLPPHHPVKIASIVTVLGDFKNQHEYDENGKCIEFREGGGGCHAFQLNGSSKGCDHRSMGTLGIRTYNARSAFVSSIRFQTKVAIIINNSNMPTRYDFGEVNLGGPNSQQVISKPVGLHKALKGRPTPEVNKKN
ncbi:hypothetical protein ACLOJK_013665 [Asimina triloba]